MTSETDKELLLRVAASMDAYLAADKDTQYVPAEFLFSDDEARTISRVLREAAGGGWQDIANAPKDGTRILAIENYQREGEDGKLYPEDAAVVSWAVSRRDGYGGWAGYGLFLASFEPTHWRPLPPPPSPEPATHSLEPRNDD